MDCSITELEKSEFRYNYKLFETSFKYSNNSLERAKEIEQHQGGKYDSLFFRSNDSLFLILTNDQFISINSKFQTFWDYIPEIDYYLLHQQSLESSNYILVSRKTGHSFSISSMPTFSPNFKHLITSKNGVGPYDLYYDGKTQIWEINPDSLILKFMHRPIEWGANSIKWLDNESICFIKNIWTGEPGGNGMFKIIKKPSKIFYKNEWMFSN